MPKIILTPNVTIQVYKFGNLIRTQKVKNKVVNGGKNLLRDLLLFPGKVTTPVYSINALAIGTGTADPAHGQTALINEVFRKEITTRIPNDGKATWQVFLDNDEANGYDLTELGLYTLLNGGTLVQRAKFTLIPKDNTISAVFSIDINIGIE